MLTECTNMFSLNECLHILIKLWRVIVNLSDLVSLSKIICVTSEVMMAIGQGSVCHQDCSSRVMSYHFSCYRRLVGCLQGCRITCSTSLSIHTTPVSLFHVSVLGLKEGHMLWECAWSGNLPLDFSWTRS